MRSSSTNKGKIPLNNPRRKHGTPLGYAHYVAVTSYCPAWKIWPVINIHELLTTGKHDDAVTFPSSISVDD